MKQNMDPGLGIDLCRICGTPTRDHQIGPCPQAVVDVFYCKPVRRASTNGTCIRCGGKVPRRANGDGWIMYCTDTCRKMASSERKAR